MVLVRQEIGDVLRDFRLQKGRTLRQVAGEASVALGYLSEVERGQKEASSEILAAVADALDTPLSVIMGEVSDRLAIVEGLSVTLDARVPDTVPVIWCRATDPSCSRAGKLRDRRSKAPCPRAGAFVCSGGLNYVRMSEFQRAMREEFGDVYAGVLVRDHWLATLGGTAQDALDRGVPAREVWFTLCEDLQVPVARRHGRGLIDPRE